MDFGRILEWFFDGLSYFSQKSRFCKNRCFSVRKLLFSRIRACKTQSKIHPKIHANFVWENKFQNNAPEMDLGRSWAPFGKGLGRSGASFGRSWALLGHFGGVQNRAFVKHSSKMGSKKASGRFWVDFAKDLGGFREDLKWSWADLDQFGMDFGRLGGRIWRSVDEFEKSWGAVSK